MPYDPERHHRQSTRLRGHDYSSQGGYFVTICTENRDALLGEIVDGRMVENELGAAVRRIWQGLPDRFPSVIPDAFVVMPNHLHGVVFLTAEFGTDDAPPLGQVMRVFKSISAVACNRLLERSGTSFWQSRFHDRIIRDERALDAIRAYIENNPANWHRDPENPLGTHS
jgi:putative transposase